MTRTEHEAFTEGYIKFVLDYEAHPLDEAFPVELLDAARRKLRQRGLIGQLPTGVGFGNLSLRRQQGGFWISGSGTGGRETLGPQGYAHVTRFDLAQGTVSCVGEVPASSETLSHAACYAARPELNAVIHIHSAALWRHCLSEGPKTPEDAEYGTLNLAWAIGHLAKALDPNTTPLVVLPGHRDGLIAWGRTLDDVVHRLIDTVEALPCVVT